MKYYCLMVNGLIGPVPYGLVEAEGKTALSALQEMVPAIERWHKNCKIEKGSDVIKVWTSHSLQAYTMYHVPLTIVNKDSQ